MSAAPTPGQEPPRFTKITDANGDHVITRDNQTGLEWATRSLGFFSNELEDSDAERACRELTLGGYDDWRCPTLLELLLLMDYSRYKPAIDEEFFPQVHSYVCSGLWTSTTYKRFSRGGYCVWVVNVSDGSCRYARRENYCGVLPVRDPNAAAAKAGA